jgi:hypothetical protein
MWWSRPTYRLCFRESTGRKSGPPYGPQEGAAPSYRAQAQPDWSSLGERDDGGQPAVGAKFKSDLRFRATLLGPGWGNQTSTTIAGMLGK